MKQSMRRAAPRFWWDFAGESDVAVVVQSDYPCGEELTRFQMQAGQMRWHPIIRQDEE